MMTNYRGERKRELLQQLQRMAAEGVPGNANADEKGIPMEAARKQKEGVTKNGAGFGTEERRKEGCSGVVTGAKEEKKEVPKEQISAASKEEREGIRRRLAEAWERAPEIITAAGERVPKEISGYIGLVRSGVVRQCPEQLLLCDLVEDILKTEVLRIDVEQLEKYLSYQKYFEYDLLPWELFVFALHNCVYRADGELRFPVLFIYVGRGAGKNGYLSYEDFCLLTPTNGVKRYNIDIFAMAEDQAKASFEDVRAMLEDNEKKMRRHFYWTKEVITNLKTESSLRFRTSNAKTKDGGRPGKTDFDEVHAFETYKLIDVAETGLGKTKHPRKTILSTDGEVRGGPLDDYKEKGRQILHREIADGGFLPFLCRVEKEKDVLKPESWTMANPSLPYFDQLYNQLLVEFSDYKQDPINHSGFATKRMNCPIGAKNVEVTSWDNILATNREVPDLRGRTCVWGIDYSKTTDFAAAGILILEGDTYYWLTHSWVCEECADLPRIKAPLRAWEVAGHLTFVPGPEIPPEAPVDWLCSQRDKYRFHMLGLDNFRYTWIGTALERRGIRYDKKSGYVKLLRPSDQMRVSPLVTSMFANQKIVWGDNPLMRWYTNNAKAILDDRGNVSYGKIEPKSRKTDGFMALVAAMGVAEDLQRVSVAQAEHDIDYGVYTY